VVKALIRRHLKSRWDAGPPRCGLPWWPACFDHGCGRVLSNPLFNWANGAVAPVRRCWQRRSHSVRPLFAGPWDDPNYRPGFRSTTDRQLESGGPNSAKSSKV